MEGQDITASSSSSASSPASLHNHSLAEGHRYEEKSPNNQEEDRKPMAIAKCMTDHTSPSFEMRMTFSEDCDDDHRAFHTASALGILDGDHIGIGIIPHAPEFLLQSYQHFAVPPEYESYPNTQAEEEKEDVDQQKMHEELQEAFFMDHPANTHADYPNNETKVVKVWRRSSRVKAAKVVRSRRSPAKFKSPRKSASRQRNDEPAEVPLEIKPTERELNSAVNRRQQEALQQWYGKLNELNQFRIAKGHCNVPQQYPPNPQLGIWVNKQRMEKKFMDDGEKSSMTEDRKRQLEKIGFTWAKRKGDYSWNEKFRELEEFKRMNGHVDVPTKYEENKALGRWVSTQRSQYKLFMQGQRSHMTQERLDELVAIGFKFDMTTAPPKPASRRGRSRYIEDEDDDHVGDDGESDEAYSF
ncbi:hypothetical protein FisN_22Lh110 [Fistulifera solaris]|uniref:Helicase-associated domain-containing protein n=1 Tax=Fistulifera solaris TaxID=1519565 RepID=A0A1Z5JBS9_FISSO|nr:hypothetical protein FisN_22Lh110 [Fistulifera solaris]|eukprot:GAX11425.1 hypothetical protein FisN_22Lh110 [Fistulifera solaris]